MYGDLIIIYPKATFYLFKGDCRLWSFRMGREGPRLARSPLQVVTQQAFFVCSRTVRNLKVIRLVPHLPTVNTPTPHQVLVVIVS